LLCLSIPALVACGQSHDDSGSDLKSGSYVGTYDDLPVADHDLLALDTMLNAKWTHFLYEMDKYSIVRDSATNDAMVKEMEYTFADAFEFNAYNADGSDFGDTQGDYSPRSWLEHQDIDGWNVLHDQSTMLVPNYQHVLKVDEMGQRVVVEGYHDHVFVGNELRVAMGAARHIAYEEIVFEKVGGVWRVTDYEETIWDASEAAF